MIIMKMRGLTQSKKISIDLAKNIDDFLTRTSDEAYIIFYGGEPLLEFKIIKELTDYAKIDLIALLNSLSLQMAWL